MGDEERGWVEERRGRKRRGGREWLREGETGESDRGERNVRGRRWERSDREGRERWKTEG